MDRKTHSYELRRTFVAAILGTIVVAVAEGAAIWSGQDNLDAAAGAFMFFTLFALYAPIAILLGLGTGLALAAFPPRMRPEELFRRALAAVRGGDKKALERSAAICGAVAASLFYLALAFLAGRHLLGRDRDPRVGAVALAVVLAVLVPACLWVRRPLAALFHRALVALSRSRAGAWIGRPAVVVAFVGVALVAGVVAVVVSRAETAAAIQFGPLLVTLGLVLAPFLLRPLVRGLLASWAGASVVLLLAAGSTVTVVTISPMAPPVVGTALSDSKTLSRWILKVYWWIGDGDGDGYASWLWGGDCNDRSARIYPGAREIPDNGIDEDCDGQDLKSSSLKRLVASVVQPGKAKAKQSPEPPKPPQPKRSILLITVDTLRWDHVSAYGYKRRTTPHIDALAAKGVRFVRAYSPSSFTPQAVPAMLAGRYPSELMRSYSHFSRYSSGNRFVAEELRAKGYRTAAMHAHFYFYKRYGLQQGFDTWDTKTVPRWNSSIDDFATGDALTRRAIRWLEKDAQRERKPIFLWIHYLDPHKNYLKHKGFSIFGDRPVDRYDGEVRYTDHQIGRLLAAFEKHPESKRAMTIISSDHGEGFGEHGYRYHGRSLYDDQVRIPFVAYWPGIKAGVRQGPVSLLDIAPTLYDFAEVAAPPELRGISLLPFLRQNAEPPANRAILGDMPPAPLTRTIRALIKGDYKLIHYVGSRHPRLFNLRRDPGERRNLRRREPARAARLLRELNAHFSLTLKIRPAKR